VIFWRRRAERKARQLAFAPQGCTRPRRCERCGQSHYIPSVGSANCQLSAVTASGSNRLASSRHATAPTAPRRAYTSLGGGRLVRVCPRLCERLGLLRLRAAVSVRLRREADWECACRGAAGPRSHVKGQSGAASLCRDPACEETCGGSPRELSRASRLDYWPPPDHRSCCSKSCFASVAAWATAATPASTDRATKVDMIVFMDFLFYLRFPARCVPPRHQTAELARTVGCLTHV
jgi:hypothetical protein